MPARAYGTAPCQRFPIGDTGNHTGAQVKRRRRFLPVFTQKARNRCVPTIANARKTAENDRTGILRSAVCTRNNRPHTGRLAVLHHWTRRQREVRCPTFCMAWAETLHLTHRDGETQAPLRALLAVGAHADLPSMALSFVRRLLETAQTVELCKARSSMKTWPPKVRSPLNPFRQFLPESGLHIPDRPRTFMPDAL